MSYVWLFASAMHDASGERFTLITAKPHGVYSECLAGLDSDSGLDSMHAHAQLSVCLLVGCAFIGQTVTFTV